MTSQGNMINLIYRFRNLCLQRHPKDIDVLSRDERDKRMGIAAQRSDLSDIFRAVMPDKPIENVCRLAKTPRLLKLILRRTFLIWEGLHGEIDFDDMLVANTIRFGAPEAFEFLLEHHKAIRGLHTDGMLKDRDARLNDVEVKWTSATKAARWDVASAKSLTQFLFPCLRANNSSQETGVHQFIQFSEPTDYWARYLAEELDPGTLRDQEILLGLAAWREDAHSSVDRRNVKLPSVLCSDKEFADKFEYFARIFLDGQDIRQLAAATFKQALALQGVKACNDSIPGFIPLWRLAIRQPIDEPEHLEWVKNEIFKALPTSLHFANDVYYYWTSNSESDVHGKPDRVELRNQVVSHAKNIFAGKPHDFIRVIDPHYMYSAHHFRVYLKAPDEGESAFTTDSGDWFSELLLEAGEINPQVIVPQIACLVIKEQDSFNGFNYSFNDGLPKKLFETEMLRLMHILSTEINVDSFNLREKKVIQTAREVATEWLKENPL